MTVQVTRVLDPIFGEPTLAYANNGFAHWVRGSASPLDQKSPTGWLACLYGGAQTGDDWARVNIPVFEVHVSNFNTAMWSYYMTNTETMGVNIVLWIHDPNDYDKRAEITQLGGHADLVKTSGWNAFSFKGTTGGMFFYGEGTTGTGLTAGTQYTWSQFQADVLFKNWTIYRITLEYGWEASGTFENSYVADVKLNGMPIFLRPDIAQLTTGSGAVYRNSHTMTDDNAYRFSDTPLMLRAVTIIVEDYVAYSGDGTTQDIEITPNDKPTIDNVDLSTLYFKNYAAGENTTVRLFGTYL